MCEALDNLGVRIGLNFAEGLTGKKRKVRRLIGGVLGFGDPELPVPMYGGQRLDGVSPEQHHVDRAAGDQVHVGGNGDAAGYFPAADRSDKNGHQEGISYTKVNRGDKI